MEELRGWMVHEIGNVSYLILGSTFQGIGQVTD